MRIFTIVYIYSGQKLTFISAECRFITTELRIVRFWFDARKAHFDAFVGEHDSAVFRSAGALVESILVEAVLRRVARVRARSALVDVHARLGRFHVLVSARTDAHEIA